MLVGGASSGTVVVVELVVVVVVSGTVEVVVSGTVVVDAVVVEPHRSGYLSQSQASAATTITPIAIKRARRIPTKTFVIMDSLIFLLG
jgi:hypothetical protein